MNIADRNINALQARTFDFQQSEGSILPYIFNYASVLNGDTITASTWSTNGTATISAASNTDTTATASLSGSPGDSTIVNTITTASGVVDERIIQLRITMNQGYVAGDYDSD